MTVAENDGQSLPGLVLARSTLAPSRTVMRAKRLGVWKPTTGADLTRAIADCAAGLRAFGLKPGETAGLLAAPCPEWLISDLAIQSAGAVSAGLHSETAPGELADIVRRCATRVLFVDRSAALDTALDLRDAFPDIRLIVCFDSVATAEAADDGVISFEALLAKGAASPDRKDAPWGALRAEDRAAILPTSGVSGPSKAPLFTHAALRAAVETCLALSDFRDGDERLSLMPASHCFERVSGLYAALAAGVTVNFPESAETAFENLRELQPQIVSGPPALWSALARFIARASAGATRLQRNLFERAMHGGGVLRGPILRKVRDDFGLGRARVALSAGAPLPTSVRSTLAALGVDVVDFYVSAETAGAIASSSDGREFALAPGGSVDIAPSGDLRIRARALPAAHADSPDHRDGWHATGDIARASGSGRFGLLGRRLAAADGAGVATFIREAEDALAGSPYILDSVVAGDTQDGLSAVLIADYDTLVRYAQARAIPFTHFKSLMEADEVRALLAAEVARVNAGLSPARIMEFTIADRPLRPGDPELGPAMNLRPRIVQKTFASLGS